MPPGFEPGDRGVADLCLTTWLWHHIQNRGIIPRSVPFVNAFLKILLFVFGVSKEYARDGAEVRKMMPLCASRLRGSEPLRALFDLFFALLCAAHANPIAMCGRREIQTP